MAEELEKIAYTYTYDQFSVFFYEDRVFIGEKDYPLGQCSVDILNLGEAVLDEIDQRVREFVSAARGLLKKKSADAASLAQEKLNRVWELVFSLPVYRDLLMDEECNYHTFERLLADKQKWKQVQDKNSEGYTYYQGMMMGLAAFAGTIRAFREQLRVMTEQYFEPLPERNRYAYADAYSRFYTGMLSVGAKFLDVDFEQSVPMEVCFVPMMYPTDREKIFVAEKARFTTLADFLTTEFYRALAAGNVPRRCHNCGRYFLLTAGYNTCYCNNIAPGETDRTCRKVGAHRKEAQGKEHQTPAQREYDRTYNRLKTRKNRKKISVSEWNRAVARAQELLAQSERGELTDDQLRRQMKAL